MIEYSPSEPHRHKVKAIEERIKEIRTQLLAGKKPHQYLGFTSKPDGVILSLVRKATRIECDVFYINIETGEISKL